MAVVAAALAVIIAVLVVEGVRLSQRAGGPCKLQDKRQHALYKRARKVVVQRAVFTNYTGVEVTLSQVWEVGGKYGHWQGR